MQTDSSYELIGIARRYLPLLRDALGMDVAWVTERDGRDQVLLAVDGSSEELGIAPGDTLSWDGAYCSRVESGEIASVISDARRDPRTALLPVTERLGIGSYVSAPITLGEGREFGMLCGVSRSPRPDLGPADARLVASLASALGEELTVFDARSRTRRVRRDQIARVVEGAGLRMVAQPIVVIPEMEVSGVEALARFDEPPPRPDRWFADARAVGLGTQLERRAIEKALEFMRELPASVYISINASPALVQEGTVQSLLEGVDPARVVLEITEHSSVGNYDVLEQRLRELRSTGVRLAVDDAGAGYASFRHILKLRPDIIKLDRDMVSGLASDSAREALVEALVRFAGRLGAMVVAEGIETREELDCLVSLGVTLGQGYFIARPAPLPLPVLSPLPPLPPPTASSG